LECERSGGAFTAIGSKAGGTGIGGIAITSGVGRGS
jgi:hypothetical protein